MDTNTNMNQVPSVSSVTKSKFFKWGIALAVVLVLALWIVGSYNSFIALNQKVDTQWAQVENQLERRFALVPNLVNSVKGATAQEQEVFTKIAEARTRYSGAQSIDQKVAAANEYQSALARLLVITENYPQLKSIDSFNNLMAELSGTENRIAVERGRFNEAVGEFNVAVKRIPGALVASLFGFDTRELFEASSAAQNAPEVNFE